MIILCPKQLIIVVNDVSPKERLDWILQALAASVKWKAIIREKDLKDDQHQIIIAELIEELSSRIVEKPNFLVKF